VPAGVVTVTSTVPALPAGLAAVICVAELTAKDAVAVPPKFTAGRGGSERPLEWNYDASPMQPLEAEARTVAHGFIERFRDRRAVLAH